jgi:uncharacterized protein YoxC
MNDKLLVHGIMDIQLLDERNCNKPLAILIDVEPEVYLNEICQIISDQVPDILPERKYEFQHHGIKISKVQEATVRLSKIALPGGDPSLCMLSLFFSNLNGAENVSKDRDLESPLSVKTEASQSTPQTHVSTVTKTIQLRSPTTVELRNLKNFTDKESGRGKEPLYRTFWNKKVQELSKCVNESWKLHRSELMELEIQEIQTKCKEIEADAACGSNDSRLKKTTLPNNVLRVQEASEAIKSLTAEVNSFSEKLKRSHDVLEKENFRKELKRAKTSLLFSTSELRKAQDALRKNLGVKKSEFAKHLSH